MIQIKNISKRFDSNEVLNSLSLEFEASKTHVLVGSSGCGKSTLLRAIIGLVETDEGEILVNNKNPRTFTQKDMGNLFGYVIQKAALFPHLTAKQNILLPTRIHQWSSQKSQKRLGELTQLVQLQPEMLEKFPSQLSGGQKQRVSLIRSLMLDPSILLMDEPLSALDPIIRSNLQQKLKEIFETLNKTVVFVTHDLHEANYLGHKLYLINDGRIEQSGLLSDFQNNPSSAFVKDFVQAQMRMAG